MQPLQRFGKNVNRTQGHFMNKGTIWIINQFAGTPDSGWGERHFYFSKYWLQQGYRVVIISGSYNHMFTKTVEVEGDCKIEEVDGRIFCWVKTPFYKAESIKRFWSMLVFTRRLLKLPVDKLGKPDFIVVSSMPIFPIIPAVFLKKKYGAKKLIFEIRDLYPLTLIHLGNYSDYHPGIMLLYWIEKYGYRKADQVVSLLPGSEAYINKISGDPGKYMCVPNGISDDLFNTADAPAKVLDAIPKNKFVVGYAGTFGLANALEFFIEAASLLKIYDDIHFVLVGDGYMKEKLLAMSKGLKNVTFIPKISKNQVQSVLRYFDVGYVGRYQSDLYKFGVSANKLFDYMLASTPVIDSIAHENNSVSLANCGIAVKPEDGGALAEAILTLYRLPKSELEAMGKRGYEFGMKNHSIESLSRIYTEYFNRYSSVKKAEIPVTQL